MLCRKAGVPDVDVRGAITSHRARSTIASQLYNAKEPMTLFELQAWPGHRSPQSTQFYAKILPNALSKAYDDAGYFARNVRTIEVQSTATPSPAVPQQPASPGSTTTSATDSAPTRYSNMRPPNDLRPLRLLHAQRIKQKPTATSENEPPADTRQHPAHRRRTSRGPRRSSRPRTATATTRHRPDAHWPDTTPG